MKIDRRSKLLLAAMSVWVLGCGGVHAAGDEAEDVVAAPPASALHSTEPAGENGGRGASAAPDRELKVPSGDAGERGSDAGAPARTDEPSEAERARGEQVAKTIGKVVLFILLIPLALLVGGGGSISFK